MAAYTPGQRIEAVCSKCKDRTGHIIVSLLDGAIAKVECCACGSVHKYKAAEIRKEASSGARTLRVRSGEDRETAVKESRPRAPRPAAPAAAKAPKPSREEQRIAKAKADIESQWEEVMGQVKGEAIPYAMSGKYALADLISHPVFGMGAVLEVTPPDKMTVIFRQGLKSLRCAGVRS